MTSRMTNEELNRYAMREALETIRRILATFPELRARVSIRGEEIGEAPPPRRRRRRKVREITASDVRADIQRARGDGLSLREALQKALTRKTLTSAELRQALEASGYKHRGSTPIGTRIAQEARALVTAGAARRTSKGWARKGGAV